MSYQVLAQKYRPQTFDDVIGQEAVTRTLKNSILNKRIANAYIFCGPRGVGKTSIARLLSKTLNCESAPDKRPCNKCDSCREIAQGVSIDVLEIDGASNRGIDEIRTLRENVKFSPSKGEFKIYIIDEVHMLTTEAFNALLKTLEEPPAHVKFVFATTEPHKVLPTIMSRCQRFDFKKIPPKMILERIEDIATKEKLDVEEKASLLIARSADGSLRDGLVILDQMVSFSGEKIIADDVIELLGMVHKDKMFELSSAVIEKDPASVAKVLDELITSGKDPVFIANSLITHYRDLMILKTTGEPTSDMAFTQEELTQLKEQLEQVSLEEILYILQNLSHCLMLMKSAMFARAPLEIALIRVAGREGTLALTEILAKLEELGEGIGGNDDIIASKPVKEEPKKKETVAPSRAAPKEEEEETTAELDENGTSDNVFDAANFNWKAVLNYVKNKKMSVFTFLNAAKPVEFNAKKLILGFGKAHAFNKEALEANGNRSIIEEAVSKVTGTPVRVEYTILEFLEEEAEDKEDIAEKKAKATEEMKPSIDQAMDVFGGQIVRDFTEDPK